MLRSHCFERFVEMLGMVQRGELAFAAYEALMSDFGALALEVHASLDKNDGETQSDAAADAAAAAAESDAATDAPPPPPEAPNREWA